MSLRNVGFGAGFGLFVYLHRRTIPRLNRTQGLATSILRAVPNAIVLPQQHSAQTGMSHSIYLLRQRPIWWKTLSDNNTVHHEASGNYYTMVQRGDGYYQQRYQVGFDGSKTNLSEERIDYIIGSGAQARSYLHQNAEGRLIELPVTWYAENNGHWGMTPGFEGPNQKDFHGVVSKDCIFCHDAYPAPESKEIEQSGEAIFHNELPHGVDCQRCHGPGAEHERLAKTEKADLNLIRAAIVNPATLPRERQLEVCMECHLSTSGSQDSNVSVRFNRETFSYKPGTPLSDYKLYFDSAGARSKGRLRDCRCCLPAAYVELLSQQPDDLPDLPQPPWRVVHASKMPAASYEKVCQGCHTAVIHKVALPATETCTSCHMPRRRGEYATQIVLTDHYIQRQKPLRDLLAPLPPNSQSQAKTALALYYPEQLPHANHKRLYLALAEAEDGTNNSSRHAPRLQEAITQLAPNESGYFSATAIGAGV